MIHKQKVDFEKVIPESQTLEFPNKTYRKTDRLT